MKIVLPVPFSWPYVVPIGAVYLWAMIPELRLTWRGRHGAARPDSPDAGSYRLIVVSQTVASTLAAVFAFLPFAQIPTGHRVLAFWLGVGLMVVGSLLRRHCWRVLGSDFTTDVRSRPGQTLVSWGAYHWLRHPSYLAALLILTGLAVALGSWASVAVLVPPSLVGYLYRIRVEERALEASLGDAYRAYKRGRKRLIPFVY